MISKIYPIIFIFAAILAVIFPAHALDLTVKLEMSDEPEDAPIVERRMDFFDFSYAATDGKPFNLREYAAGKRLVIVSFVAGWCRNSIRNAHVVKRLYDKYGNRGLGVVVVTEYSSADEVRIFINRIGIDYPVVGESIKRDDRKKTLHYKYRHGLEDTRKWGTPFYVIIDGRDIEPLAPKSPLARRIYTISGEMIESEAERFIEEHIQRRER